MRKWGKCKDGHDPLAFAASCDVPGLRREGSGLVAAYLLANQPQPWAIKKGAVWWLRNRDREGGAQVVLQTVMGPEFL